MERALGIFDGPDYLNLRKAFRALIVCPLLLALGLEVLDNEAIATYSFFASFVPLVFADYGGPTLRRAGAYCTALVLGIVVILLGAVLAFSMVTAALGMFAVMFLATFATAFGGYRALHVAPIALAYSISALEPLSELGIADRVIGWALGCGAALVAAAVMWPIDRRSGLRAAAAALAADLAEAVRSLDDPGAARTVLDRANSDASSLHASLATPLRPYGPAQRDVSFVHMVEHLVHAVDIVAALIEHGPDDVDSSLLAGIANSLDRTSSMLASGIVDVATDEQLAHLDRARVLGIDVLEQEAARRTETGAGVSTMMSAMPLLSLSHVVLWVEASASMVIGAGDGGTPVLETAPEVHAPSDDLRSRMRRSVRTVRSELDPDGVILRNSFRAGVALAAAIIVADVLPVEHGFWIVLATMLVLHSSAHSTYATAVGAIEGTLIGIAIGVATVVLFGDATWLHWVLLPIVVFAAGYLPGGVNFIAGQASFGLLVIVLFELLDTPGMGTAVVRIETVLAGAITATVLSLVLWPRGARAAMAAGVSALYRTAAVATSTFVRGGRADRAEHAAKLSAASRRAEASFAVALAEHSQPVDATAWARVLAPPTLTRALVVGLVATIDDEPVGCIHALTAVDRSVDAAAERLTAAADVLGGSSQEPGAFTPVTNDQLEACVDSCASSVEQMQQALHIVGWSAMIRRLIDDIHRASDALDEVAAASAPRAWLFGPSHHSSD